METLADKDTLYQGDMLNWYRIERVLGRGGFGVTYLAHDTNLDHQVAIKEYLPEQISHRAPDNSVRPVTENETQLFHWGLDRFITEARTLAKFKHPNIVRVMSVFERNDTAYMVMEFERGQDLKQLLRKSKLPNETFLKNMIVPVTYGLAEVHRLGFIHRDIKPANIYVRENRTPVLIDFGSARQALGSQTQHLTTMVTVGYAPLEQYADASESQQGPWTDIYALGAVMHYAITGRAPVESTLRASSVLNDHPDPLQPLSETAAPHYSQQFLQAIDWALGFKVADRPRSLEEWRASLLSSDRSGRIPVRSGGTAAAIRVPPVTEGSVSEGGERLALQAEKPVRQAKYRNWMATVAGLVIGVGVATVLGYLYFTAKRNDQSGESVTLQNEMEPSQQLNAKPDEQKSEKARQQAVQRQVELKRQQAAAEAEYQAELTRQKAAAAAKQEIELKRQRAAVAADPQAELERQQAAVEVERKAKNLKRQQAVAEAARQAELKRQQAAAEAERKKAQANRQRPITQSDIQLVTGNFNALRLAIQRQDKVEIARLAHQSDSRDSFLHYVFTQFETVEVALTSISTQRARQTIQARLEIRQMVRANGDRATPAAAYRQIPLRSERIGDSWSKIIW